MAATLDEIAKNVVVRARSGDQNAMALIAETRKSANSGTSPRARAMMHAIFSYCGKNPVSPSEESFEGSSVFSPLSGESLSHLKGFLYAPQDVSQNMLSDELLTLAQDKNPKSRHVAAYFLSMGPQLTPEIVFSIADLLGEDLGATFVKSANNEISAPMNKKEAHGVRIVMRAGRILGRARALQCAYMGDFSHLSKRAAAEGDAPMESVS